MHEVNFVGPSSRVRVFRNKKESHHKGDFLFFRAGKGTRTLAPALGKVVLYQLSYSRGGDPNLELKKSFVKGKRKIFAGKFWMLGVEDEKN